MSYSKVPGPGFFVFLMIGGCRLEKVVHNKSGPEWLALVVVGWLSGSTTEIMSPVVECAFENIWEENIAFYNINMALATGKASEGLKVVTRSNQAQQASRRRRQPGSYSERGADALLYSRGGDALQGPCTHCSDHCS